MWPSSFTTSPSHHHHHQHHHHHHQHITNTSTSPTHHHYHQHITIITNIIIITNITQLLRRAVPAWRQVHFRRGQHPQLDERGGCDVLIFQKLYAFIGSIYVFMPFIYLFSFDQCLHYFFILFVFLSGVSSWRQTNQNPIMKPPPPGCSQGDTAHVATRWTSGKCVSERSGYFSMSEPL